MTAGQVSGGNIIEARSVTAHGEQGRIPGAGRFREACRDFEAVFVRHLLKTMRSSGGWKGFLKRNRAEKVFRGHLDAVLADSVSEREALGIAQILYRQLGSQYAESDDHKTQVICDA